MIRMRMLDGSEREVPRGTSLQRIAGAARAVPADSVVCAVVDGVVHDLRDGVWEDGQVTFLTSGSPDGARVLLHTAAHVVAQAAKRLFPEASLGRDPKSRDLFQVDLEIGSPLRESDLEAIQAEAARIIADDFPIERHVLSKGDARTWLIRRGEVLKLEILEAIGARSVTIYAQGEFSDLCRGPHLLSTGQLPAIRLVSVEEVAWQGYPGGERLSRIGGVCARPA